MTGHVHFLGICGYAVSGAALLAREQGWRVSGSDDQAYPPTTDILTAAGIDWVDGSDPANLERWGIPDLVVVGNQTRVTNPEWLAARERGLPTSSEIEFYLRLTADRVRIAVCGTHGKTTTSVAARPHARRLRHGPGLPAGIDVARPRRDARRLGTGPFVFEGDEYTTAPWDPRPKFLHIHPGGRLRDPPRARPSRRVPDARRVPRALRGAGARRCRATACSCCARTTRSASPWRASASCPVTTYGTRGRRGLARRRSAPTPAPPSTSPSPTAPATHRVTLTFPGVHNALNATAALLLAVDAGAPLARCIEACATFRGPARRFEVLGEVGGVTVVDDYAHHPTEVEVTIAAARQPLPGTPHRRHPHPAHVLAHAHAAR